MSTVKSSAAVDKSNGTEQASVQSRSAQIRRRINTQMIQNVLLIWLDENIDDNSADCCHIITRLQGVINTISIFTDGDQCIEFLGSMVNEKACMVISDSLGQEIVPRIHHMVQVDSIFIFCNEEKRHERWVNGWPKVKGIFTEFASIYEGLRQAAQQCEQNSISISLMPTNGDVFKKNLNQLEPTFMYTQILKEILLLIKFEENHFVEFINSYRDLLADNETQRKKVDELAKKYYDETPIWWYTYDYFLYPILNRALRIMDVDRILRLGFFITDLHHQIEQLYAKQFSDQHSKQIFTVYRGQGMLKTEFEHLFKTKGGLLSFNNFLSTSKNRDVSLLFADSNRNNPDLVGILFVMTIDSSLSSPPFACINSLSNFQVEDEVLFAMHTVFRICDVKLIPEYRSLFQIELSLTSDHDKDLRVLTDRIREETFPDQEAWYRLGRLLLNMGQSKKAQQVYEILLEQTTDESKIASIYRLIGCAKTGAGEYKEAITFFEKTMQIYNRILPANHLDMANCYNNIGLVYYNMGDDPKALESHEKAVEIRQQSLSPNHPDIAMSYNNIGLVYDNMIEDSKALEYHEKALEIRQQSLPTNHPYLAASYGNIGLVYYNMGEYSKALESHEKALEIQRQSLPPIHSDLAASCNNIANVYFMMNDYSNACFSYKRALEIGEQTLPSNHPHVQTYRKNLELVTNKL